MTEEVAKPIVLHLFGQEGIGSTQTAETESAFRAIECLVRDDAELVAPLVIPLMEKLLDSREADALSPTDLRIFETPEGKLQSETYKLTA